MDGVGDHQLPSILGRAPMAGAQRVSGRGRHGFSAPRQHGGPGLLGADPSSQPPAQVQPPVPVPLPSEKRAPTPLPPASSSPSSHVKAPPVSDPVKSSYGDGRMTAAATMDYDAQDDVFVGLSGSTTAAMNRDDILGLKFYKARKKQLSKKADDEEEDTHATKKKTRLAWGEGLAKYENRQSKKDDETTHKLVAHDGATGETASSHGSSPPAGSKGHCDNNSLDHMAKMRVSHVSTAPALFSKRSSTRSQTDDLSDPGKKESISSLTKKVVSPAGCIGDLPIIFPEVYAVPCKVDNSNSNSCKTAIAVSELASSSQGCDAPPDESSMKFTKVQEVPPRMEKVIVNMVQKPTTMMQSQENCSDENDAAPLLSGIATIKASKNSERMNTKEEDVEKPVNQIPHESMANLLAHSLPDKGHGESSTDENEHETGKVLVGESNAAPSALAMKSSHSDCLTISETEAPVLENFNEDSCSNEAVCITKSSSMVKENVSQSVLIANHGDEGNCVAGGSCGQDNLKITFFPDERSAKPASGTIEGDQIRSGAKTVELCSSMKECNDAATHHSWKATETKLANSNIDDGKMAPSDMKRPNSKDNPCITSDPEAILTGPASVQHVMESDEAMENKESENNDDKVKGKEGNNLVLCVASKHGSGIQLSCEVDSQKDMEKVDSFPSPEETDLNADMETLTPDSGPCVPTNASVVRDDGLIQRLRASEAMYGNPENSEAKVKSNEGNPVHSVASKESNGMQLSCNVTAEKGKGIIPSPEVNDLNAPPMQVSYGALNTYHLPSSSGSAEKNMVHANSSYVAMDIDLNIPLDLTPTNVTAVDLGSNTAEACMGRSSEATDSNATMGMISPPQTTQTSSQHPANQPGCFFLFGRPIYPGTYHQAGSSALINMMNQHRQQAVANVTPNSIMRGGVPVVHSLIPGSSGGAGFINFNGFNSVQQPWPYHAVDTSRVVIGHPFYYPGATADQDPATVNTILSIGTSNGEGASTSNASSSLPTATTQAEDTGNDRGPRRGERQRRPSSRVQGSEWA